jgi:hypothetical protein
VQLGPTFWVVTRYDDIRYVPNHPLAWIGIEEPLTAAALGVEPIRAPLGDTRCPARPEPGRYRAIREGRWNWELSALKL